MKTEAITIPESKRLIALEQTIERGKQTFVEVGLALAEIRDSRLYRSDYKTFEEYCREKWAWDRTYCHRLIEASNTVNLLPIGNKEQVTTESQARELAKVPQGKRAGVLLAAAKAGQVTAATIKQAAKPLVEPVAESHSAPSKTPAQPSPEDDNPFAEPTETPARVTPNAKPQPKLSPLAQQVHDELDVVIDDAQEIIDELEQGELDADALNTVASELSRVVKLIHKLAKEATCAK